MDIEAWSEQIAVAAFIVDDHGRICAANRGFRALMGAGNELVGTSLRAVTPDEVDAIDAQNAASRIHLIDLLALPRSSRSGASDGSALGAPAVGPSSLGPGAEFLLARGRLHRADGLTREVLFRVFALAAGAAEGSGAGRLDCVLVSTDERRADVVFQRAASEPRQASPQEPSADRVYQKIFDHSPVGIFHFDARGILTACNDVMVRILGASRAELVGIDLATLQNAEIKAAIRGALEGSTTVFTGTYLSVTGKKESILHAEFAPIFDASRAIVGGVALVQDMTEHRKTERAAERADRMASLATLAAGTVHEMQDPLALVVTSLELATRVLQAQAPASARGDSGELATAIATAREGAAAIADLTKDLSAFARGDDELRSLVDTEKALDAAIALVRPAFRDKATLERRYEAVPRVRAIEGKLVHLFKSLLQNAADAIEPGQKDKNKISIGVHPVGDRVEVTISDTGRGLAPEARRHLFEPFFTDKPGALGLGLPTAHGITRSFGGELRLVETSDLGTTFAASFPASEAKAEITPSTPPVARTSTRAHLLVIDDEERLAETLRMALAYSHDVTIATSGNDALAKLRRVRPEDGEPAFDLVLCDLFLPDISGPDIYAEIQRTRPDLLARFVFLTGGAFTESARRFLQNIDNPRLEKPFDLNVLEDLISERLALFGR